MQRLLRSSLRLGDFDTSAIAERIVFSLKSGSKQLLKEGLASVPCATR